MTLTLNRFATPAHTTVAQMVADTLTLGGDSDLGPYWGLTRVLRTRLSRHERQGLAWAALMACDDDEVEGIAEAVLGPWEGAGAPYVPFLELADEAADWATWATDEERRTYLVACFNALPLGDRVAFLSLMVGRAAA